MQLRGRGQKRTIRLSASLGFLQSYLIFDYHFFGNITSTRPILISDNNSLSIYGRWERFIPVAKTNIEIRTSFFTNNGKLAQAGILYSTHSSHFGIKSVLARKFWKRVHLNIDAYYGRNYFSTDINPTMAFDLLKVNPFVSVSIGKFKISSALHYRQSTGKEQNQKLLGTQLKIQTTIKIKGEDSNIALKVFNLHNQKTYNTLIQTDYFLLENHTEAVPPFLICSFNYSL